MGEFETGAFFFCRSAFGGSPEVLKTNFEMVASKSVFYSQGKSNIIAMEISRMFPGKNTKSKRCSIFHCHVSSRVQLSTEVFVLVAWFKWRVWRVMLSGMHSSSNPSDKRPHPFSHFKNSGSTTFFSTKKRSTNMNTWNCWRWLLTFHHCLGEIWDCLIRHGWGPAFEWWEGRRDAQGFFGLTWPQKQSSL